jgi:hypothetical protein
MTTAGTARATPREENKAEMIERFDKNVKNKP